MASLYWMGGPARVKLYHGSSITEYEAQEVVQLLDDFRSQCQRLWFAFSGTINGRDLAVQRFQQMKATRHNTLSVGSQFPDAEQSVGKSTFARITFGELIDGLVSGGEFEQLNAKAMLVFIDALWEDSTRRKIADPLSVKGKDVKCDLMADIRRLRNLIIHQSDSAKQDYVQKASFLPLIWTIDPNEVIITGAMLQPLFEQLNAIQVHVGEA